MPRSVNCCCCCCCCWRVLTFEDDVFDDGAFVDDVFDGGGLFLGVGWPEVGVG